MGMQAPRKPVAQLQVHHLLVRHATFSSTLVLQTYKGNTVQHIDTLTSILCLLFAYSEFLLVILVVAKSNQHSNRHRDYDGCALPLAVALKSCQFTLATCILSLFCWSLYLLSLKLCLITNITSLRRRECVGCWSRTTRIGRNRTNSSFVLVHASRLKVHMSSLIL
jgi:hypothetical protein